MSACSVLIFGGLKQAGLLRIAEDVEDAGMDQSEHGGDAGSVIIVEDVAAAKKYASEQSKAESKAASPTKLKGKPALGQTI